MTVWPQFDAIQLIWYICEKTITFELYSISNYVSWITNFPTALNVLLEIVCRFHCTWRIKGQVMMHCFEWIIIQKCGTQTKNTNLIKVSSLYKLKFNSTGNRNHSVTKFIKSYFNYWIDLTFQTRNINIILLSKFFSKKV